MKDDADGAGARLAAVARRARDAGVQTGKDFIAANAPMWAATIAYQALLSAFPLFLAAMAVAVYVVDPDAAIHQAATRLGAFLPEGGAQLASIAHRAVASRAQTGGLSILAWLWTGSAIFDTLTLALNAAYDVEETYSFRKRVLIDMLMLVTVGLSFVLAAASAALTALLASVLQVPPLLLLVAYFLIYRFVPRGKQDWRAAFVGAVVATPLFFAARVLFLWIVRQFGQYNLL
ncbi:MAG: YihY/virulence factor BrkB family protein [Chloroflexota bacterium]